MATLQTVNITAKFEHRLCKVNNEQWFERNS